MAITVTVAACGGGEAITTTTTTTAPPRDVVASSLVLGESGAPPGTELAASLSWQQLRTDLDDLLGGGVVDELESLGLIDASADVFVSPTLSDASTVGLASGGMLAVSITFTFRDDAGADSALEIIEEAAMVYAGAANATPQPFDVVGVATGAVGLAVNEPSFPGGAAAVAWVEGAVVRISFAQGGDSTRDARTLAKTLTEVGP